MGVQDTVAIVTKQDYIHSVFFTGMHTHSHKQINTQFRSMHSKIHQSSGVCSCITPAGAECYFWAKAHLCAQARNMLGQANIVVSVQKKTPLCKQHLKGSQSVHMSLSGKAKQRVLFATIYINKKVR